ncbi:MAG: hypothetical protein B7733_05120 [Myxococcales bacterium FL481]|nr:MAG: hypothetical protein B7733_05120 [Myxococcales bacterium FL481]
MGVEPSPDAVRLPPGEVARVQNLSRLAGRTWLLRGAVVVVWFAVALVMGGGSALIFAYHDVAGIIALSGVFLGLLAPVATVAVRRLNGLYSERRLALYPPVGDDIERLTPTWREPVLETRLARSTIEGLDDGALAVRAACHYLEYLEAASGAVRQALTDAGVGPGPIREIVFRGDGEASVQGELSQRRQQELLLHLERFEHALWHAAREDPYR